MYLTAVHLLNFCRLGKVEINFPKERQKGWHVILGDNASGKTSVLRGIAIALINRPELAFLKIQKDRYIAGQNKFSIVILSGEANQDFDDTDDIIQFNERSRPLSLVLFHRQPASENIMSLPAFCKLQEPSSSRNIPIYQGNEILGGHIFCFDPDEHSIYEPSENPLIYRDGWFSASYGPFRRLTGGNSQWQDLSNVAPRAAAHITLFDESAALTDVLDWLKDLDRRQLKEQSRQQPGDPEPESARIFNGVRHFINHSELLPGGVQFIEVNLDGVPVFRDANGHDVTVAQLSDGFRSILSVAFDLVRQLIRVYGLDKVFPPGQSDITSFPLPGVVLIDEVDAHLHPTWQTRIGQWFTKHFPEMQFIVTTHSPLICRACEHGTIWRLPPPGSEGGIEQITGAEKDRLVYGNVLDAYETQAFGAQMSRGEEGRHAQQEYLDLYYKRLYNVPMNEEEQARLEQLEAVFHSHVAIDED